MKNLIFLAVLFSILSIQSCDTKECCDLPPEQVTIQWTGQYIVDGCGYIFTFSDGMERKATNEETVPVRFNTGDEFQVGIEYTNLSTETIQPCFSPQKFETFELLSID